MRSLKKCKVIRNNGENGFYTGFQGQRDSQMFQGGSQASYTSDLCINENEMRRETNNWIICDYIYSEDSAMRLPKDAGRAPSEL